MKITKTLLLPLFIGSFFIAKAQYATYQDTLAITTPVYNNKVECTNYDVQRNENIYTGKLDDGTGTNLLFYVTTNFGGQIIQDTIFHIGPSSYGTPSQICKTIVNGNNIYTLLDFLDNNFKNHSVFTHYNRANNTITAKEIVIANPYLMGDSLSLFAKNMIQTIDGNFLMVLGTDNSNMGDNVILLKTDSGGNEIWNKFYSANKSAIVQPEINNIIQKKDSGFVLFGNCVNQLTDTTQTIIVNMSKTGVFLSADQVLVNNSGFVRNLRGISITPKIINNAVHIYAQATDTINNNDIPAIFKYDLTNNQVVWANQYDIPSVFMDSGFIETSGYLSQFDNKIRVQTTYDDVNLIGHPVLFQTNLSGNILNANTYWPNTQYQSLKINNFANVPSDGGIVMGGYFFINFNASAKIYTIKTDAQLNSGCQDSAITITQSAINLQILPYQFDSAGTFTVNTPMALTIAPITGGSITYDSICKCDISISGKVDTNLVGLDSMFVCGFKFDTAHKAWVMFDSTITDTGGNYTLQNAPPGQVVIAAKPLDTTVHNIIMSFYKDTGKTWKWKGATKIDTYCDSTYNNYNVRMIHHTINANDTNELSGHVYKGINYGRMHSKQLNDPIPGIDIVVVDSSSNIVVAGGSTDDSGAYHFKYLSNGTAYTVWCVVPGLSYDSTYTRTFVGSINSFSSLDFYVDSDKIYIPNPLGIKTIHIENNNISLVIYPNPAKEELNAKFYLKQPTNVEILLTDIMGRTVINKSLGEMNSGIHKENINLKNIHSGLYILKVKAGNDFFVKKLMKE